MEMIVVDDSNQNDDIENYVTSLNDGRISYHHNRPSLGAVKNWNSGLRLCHGEYIMVVHHDEAMKSEYFLKEIQQQLQNNDIVVCNIEVHHANGKVYGLYSSWIKKFVISHPSLLFAVNAIGPCSVVAFKNNLLEPFDEKTNWFVDVEWYYRLMKGRKVAYNPSIYIISEHGHKGQITNNIDTAIEARKDTEWLSVKYASNKSVRCYMWFQINVLHNDKLRRMLKKILGR